jgi:ADP-heptose:LPS heptosyltransferase
MSKFLISTICMNRNEGVRACLEAVFNHSTDYDLVLTNQNSSDGTKEFFDELASKHPHVTVFHEIENTFFQYPNNRSFELARQRGCKFMICLNDDCIVPAGWLQKLEEPFRNDSKMAVAGPAGGCYTLSPDFHGYGGQHLDYIEGSTFCIDVSKVPIGEKLFPAPLERIYSEDSHRSLLMKERGFKIAQVNFTVSHPRSQTVNRDPETKRLCMEAQEKNHIYCRRRWRHYLSTRKFDYPIVVRRKIARGDVLLATPIIRAIKEVQPLAQIVVETDYPDMLKGNPYVRQAIHSAGTPKDALVCDLNMAYEKRTDVHILDAYMDVARGSIPALENYEFTNRKLDIFPGLADGNWAFDFRKGTAGNKGKLALIHAGPTAGRWPGKEWPMDRFSSIATWLVKKGFHVAVVGSLPSPQIKDAIHLEGKTSIAQLAALCARADLMVTIDSLPLHIAQAMGTPTVALFGVSSSKYILTRPENTIGIDGDPNDGHTGLRHKIKDRVHFTEGKPSIDWITLDMVKTAIENVLK